MALSTRTQIKQKIKKEKRMDSLVGREDTLTAVAGVGYQTASDVNALIAQYLIDNPVSTDVIKSIQRGTAQIPNSANSATATITAVDTAKSVLIISSTASGNDVRQLARGQITDSTTLTFTRRVMATDITFVEWQVIEYV